MTSTYNNNRFLACLNLVIRDEVIVGVRIHSSRPWNLTMTRGMYFAMLLEATGESYEAARDALIAMYPQYWPELARKFPIQ